MSEQSKTPKIEELNQLYKEADEVDKEVFADQRSNLRLVAGDHYSRRNAKFWDRIRDSRDLPSEQKLRLTKNHIYKISKVRKNVLLSHACGVTIVPAQESELQSQKSAELNKKVWNAYCKKHDFKKMVGEFATDFFDIGEVATKLYFDPDAGDFLGMRQKVDDQGQPMVDENGQMVAGDEPVFRGDIVAEKLYAFNLLRHPQAKTMKDSPVLIVRKVVPYKDLEAMVPEEDEDRRKMIAATRDDTYVIFDSSKNQYYRDKDVTTLREYYWRKCKRFPNGWFQITVEGGILWEGELPFGIYPIIYEGHDEVPTTPRHASPIKQLRPCQIEINRGASKRAEHQVTLGDDKLVLVNGSKISKGSDYPGVRSMTVTGQAPVVIGGRSGDQYAQTISDNISEMYDLAEIPEELEEKGQGDAWGELFKAVRQKKKFIVDSEKFESFQVKFCETYLDLARNYFDEDYIAQLIGADERINISEFKNTKPQCYQIHGEPMSEDMESMMGKQLMLNHILQYGSSALGKDDIGKLIRLMPYANNEQAFNDLTLSYDRANNIILQLDRGEAPKPSFYDDGPYIIKRLSNRQVQGDFVNLDPQIQQNYERTISLYEQIEADKQRKIQAAEADFIPTDGAMIKVAWYVKDPTNPSRSIQATLPASSIQWLVQRLEDQGQSQQQLADIGNSGALAQIAEKYKQQSGMQGQPPAQGPVLTRGGIQ